MHPILVALLFHCVAKVDWSSSSGSHDFLLYDFATRTVQGNSAERIAPVKRQKVDDGPVVPEAAPTVDINWLPSVAHKTVSGVEGNYQQYHGISDGDEGFAS